MTPLEHSSLHKAMMGQKYFSLSVMQTIMQRGLQRKLTYFPQPVTLLYLMLVKTLLHSPMFQTHDTREHLSVF